MFCSFRSCIFYQGIPHGPNCSPKTLLSHFMTEVWSVASCGGLCRSEVIKLFEVREKQLPQSLRFSAQRGTLRAKTKALGIRSGASQASSSNQSLGVVLPCFGLNTVGGLFYSIICIPVLLSVVDSWLLELLHHFLTPFSFEYSKFQDAVLRTLHRKTATIPW